MCGGQQLRSASTVPSEKHPANIHVWGILSYHALFHLHVVPQKTTINGEYYRSSILANECQEELNRTAQEGSISERALLPDPSQAVFMQDGAPPRSTKRIQEWCRESLPSFWASRDWPENRPDLNPIEDLWAIVLRIGGGSGCARHQHGSAGGRGQDGVGPDQKQFAGESSSWDAPAHERLLR